MVVVVADDVPKAPVLTGLCRDDDCLPCRLCTSPSLTLLNKAHKKKSGSLYKILDCGKNSMEFMKNTSTKEIAARNMSVLYVL